MKTEKALEEELQRRFHFQRGPPPHGPTSSREFREQLVKLLVGSWDFDEASSCNEKAVEDLFAFFNGNLLREDQWSHYCVNDECCSNRAEAMSKARPVIASSRGIHVCL